MKNYLSQILEQGQDLTPQDIVLRMAVACVIAAFIYLSYRLSHDGSIYSRKFNVSLVALTVITTMVMVIIGNNLSLSLGMVGALSIVRFRTAIKDSRDTVYIFWTVVAGICCGAGDFLIAGIGSAVTFLVLLLFGRIKNDRRMLMIIRTSRANEENIESLIFRRYKGHATLRVKNTTEDSIEFIYEVSKSVLDKSDRKTNKSITDEVYDLGSVEYFNLVMQNDDISS